jgi:hypothetical protein
VFWNNGNFSDIVLADGVPVNTFITKAFFSRKGRRVNATTLLKVPAQPYMRMLLVQ